MQGKQIQLQVLAVLEFNSDRKRMSILCRLPDGRSAFLQQSPYSVLHDYCNRGRTVYCKRGHTVGCNMGHTMYCNRGRTIYCNRGHTDYCNRDHTLNCMIAFRNPNNDSTMNSCTLALSACSRQQVVVYLWLYDVSTSCSCILSAPESLASQKGHMMQSLTNLVSCWYAGCGCTARGQTA